ncbi:hypothetical protein B0H63DRAFT_299823 [Podospora didyma]|uniref:DUF1746 domain-containing protein n=1 Tax=Podospora didyma TaxID=330526 RepID=A0AAE0N7Q3_9PEZI|nr:hypothetical protein B0H63DRAFT_299823 [Podospora didyma]
MNHDPAPSSSSASQGPRQPNNADDPASHARSHDERSREASASQSTEPSFESSQQEKRRRGLVKKHQFMNHLQKSLDTVVFAYICTLYYMECSLPRFLLRLLPHFLFLSPKEGMIPLPAHRPHVFAIFVPNLICILLHSLLSLPHASESTRGYLHGGVIVDFIGQKPPTSRLGPLLIDIVILATQCLMLSVHQDRERLRKVLFPSQETGTATTSPSDEGGSPGPLAITQDHDAEERGILRDQAALLAGGGPEGIELQLLAGGNRQQNDGESPEVRERMAANYPPVTTGIDLVDIMRSGGAIIGHFHVVHAARTVGNDYQNAAAYSLQSLGYNGTLAALAAERRARIVAGQERPRQE